MYIFINISTAVSKFSLTCGDKDCTFCLLKKVDLLVGLHQLSDFFLPHASCEKMEFQYLLFVEDQQCLKLWGSVQSNKPQTQEYVALHCKEWLLPNSISSGSLIIFLWRESYLKHWLWKHLLRPTCRFAEDSKIFFFWGDCVCVCMIWEKILPFLGVNSIFCSTVLFGLLVILQFKILDKVILDKVIFPPTKW